ncbi:MAG TPA: aldo/keto reductase [Kiritimatiellia bacterium]|nr:aldo/keto reductase [Kiritimatiellia bacterium]HRZ11244.1 aldo/keto reductase [Kiritimatiellia bacterium]HSA19095.1 aldo/keto reductase [Kiritimatiellia bacterium]
MAGDSITRRSFLKALTLAGTGSLLSAGLPASAAGEGGGTVPRRILGRTGVHISSLCLGGIFDVPANQHILHRALQLGVTCWDTAEGYHGDRSEAGFGQFFEKQPAARRDVFLITKTDAHHPEGLSNSLKRSLEKLRTDHIDLYLIHDLRGVETLTDDVRDWAEAAKGSGRIRYFGFSTHRNMAQQLRQAAALGWLDAVLSACNFRLLQAADMQAALEQCGAAGLGVIGMKAQGGGPVPADAGSDLAGQFLGRGFTAAQAKLKAIWENPAIASICSQMHVARNLEENSAAAMDRTALSSADRARLALFAQATCEGYCAGCERFCGPALGSRIPISDLMRGLMYARDYGNPERARDCLRAVGPGIRDAICSTDFTLAERACPQGLPIGRLAREALELLA